MLVCVCVCVCVCGGGGGGGGGGYELTFSVWWRNSALTLLKLNLC